MAISANTLFHFTKFEFLEKILKDKCLFPHYCFENLLNLNMVVAFPLLSFTDIPLEQISIHALKYGGNGLGLKKKEWGIEKGKRTNQIVNPVFYITEKSHINSMFGKILRTYFKDNALHVNGKERIIVQLFLETLGLYKLHEGYEWDKGANKFKGHQTNFYDEREWRYLPDVLSEREKEEHLPINFYPNDEFYDAEKKFKFDYFESKNKEIEKYKLEFTADDIDYIYVEDESKIYQMTEVLREAFSESDCTKLISKLSMIPNRH